MQSVTKISMTQNSAIGFMGNYNQKFARNIQQKLNSISLTQSGLKEMSKNQEYSTTNCKVVDSFSLSSNPDDWCGLCIPADF